MSKFVDFIPIPNDLLKEIGNIYGAYLYGYVFVNTDADGIFRRSKARIQQETTMSDSTIKRWLDILCDDGYLERLTPKQTNKSVAYRCTDKLVFNLEIAVRIASERPQKSRGSEKTPRGGFKDRGGVFKEPHGGVLKNPHDHEHDMHEHVLNTINSVWQSLGLAPYSLPKTLELFADKLDSLELLVTAYVEADQDGLLPDDWGPGLLVQKIRAGEMPPEKPKTFADEVRELMEYHQNGGKDD